jgi:hypothetical protein
VLIGEPGGGDPSDLPVRTMDELPACTVDELAEALAAHAWPGRQ